MSNKIIIGVSAAILLAGMAGVAVAKHHDKKGHGMRGHGFGHKMSIMRNADADKDGKITKEELNAAHEKKFKEFDLDSDGVVTQEEVQKKLSERFEKLAKKITRRFDDNRDGKVTAAEFQEHAAQKLYRLDLNDDGVITKDERRGKRWAKHHKRRWGHGGHHKRHWKHREGRGHGKYHHRGSYGDKQKSESPVAPETEKSETK